MTKHYSAEQTEHLLFAFGSTRKDMDQIEDCLINGADPNVLDSNGFTLIHHLLNEHSDINSAHCYVRLLLDYGANPNMVDTETGDSHLHFLATCDEAYDNIQTLVKFGADVNHKNN